MKKSKVKVIATWIIVPLMAAIFILDIVTVVLGNKYAKKYLPSQEYFTFINGDDRIHFLNTANSDCILIESNGHFALVDSGEGNNNPRRKEAYHGFEETVTAYLKKVLPVVDGKFHLDFIIGTHYHYDHVGSFVSIINDDRISIDKAYFKKYNSEMDSKLEAEKWGLSDCYNDIISAVKDNNIELIQNIPNKIDFQDFELRLFNTGYYNDLKGKGENSGSVGIKVIKGSKSAFLASDITGPSGVEKKVEKDIGHCDLLKIGHHGYYGSSSMHFLDCLTPAVAVVTNQQGKVYPNVKWNLTMHAKVPFYGTYDYNGIVATFTDDNRIILTNNIH